MKNTSFYVAIYTRETFDSSEMYDEQSHALKDAVESIFQDKDTLLTFLKGTVASCHTEIEVSHDEELCAKCVVDVETEGKVGLDKAKLTSTIRTVSHFPNLKVEKKLVPA